MSNLCPHAKAQLNTDNLENFEQTIHCMKKWCRNAYEICRTVATEILVFMVNDLDRTYNKELNNAHPVAYAMKGPSLRNETFKNMMMDVITELEKKGLCVLATSADGQWNRYGVRGPNDEPLTILQLQKDHWRETNKKNKAKLQSEIKTIYKVASINEVYFTKSTERTVTQAGESIVKNIFTVFGHKTQKPLVLSVNVKRLITEPIKTTSIRRDESLDYNDTAISEKNSDGNIIGLLDENVFEDLNTEMVTNVDHVLHEMILHDRIDQDCLVDDNTLDDRQMSTLYHNEQETYQESTQCYVGGENVAIDASTISELKGAFSVLYNTDVESEFSYENDRFNVQDEIKNDHVNIVERQDLSLKENRIDSEHFNNIFSAVKNVASEQRKQKFNALSLSQFKSMFKSKSSVMKNFHKTELLAILDQLPTTSKNLNTNPLRSLFIFEEINDMFHKDLNVGTVSGRSKSKFRVKSLRSMCCIEISKLHKDVCAAVIAEYTWKDRLNEWKLKGVFDDGTELVGLEERIEWFSQPSIINGHVTFHFTDACHLLTCLRSKICTTGITGLKKIAWEGAAISNTTDLSIPIVYDCIDKQSVSFAKRVFASDVEKWMLDNGFSKEAEFCNLIRNWFDSEDEPEIPALERVKKRVRLLQWLSAGFELNQFPPSTRYIRGIPIVTYEALRVNIERKIQIYPFCPRRTYNARALGSQEVEQFFSSFRDLDCSGNGTPKPDNIPFLVGTAASLDNYRLNPNRPFFMRTADSTVYPTISFEDSGSLPPENRADMPGQRISKIEFQDHIFDCKSNKHHKRKNAQISAPDQPAYGEVGVRQWRDDSKLPAHIRRGFVDIPE